jgi:hypothetical protein
MNDEPRGAEEQSLLDEIDARVQPTEFEIKHFPGGMIQVIMELPAEMLEQINQLADHKGWPRRDAFVATLANGIGAFEEAEVRELRGRADVVAHDRLDLLEQHLRQMEVSYAAMKFRTWELLQAYQSANLSDGAMRTQVVGLGHLVDRLRSENEDLRARLQQAEESLQQAKAAAVMDDDGLDQMDRAAQVPSRQAEGLKARLVALLRASR